MIMIPFNTWILRQFFEKQSLQYEELSVQNNVTEILDLKLTVLKSYLYR